MNCGIYQRRCYLEEITSSPKKKFYFVLSKSKAIIKQQPIFLDLVPPLIICGDIHGQFYDLLRIIQKCGDPANVNYLFLGDYVDRGEQSINTICLLLLFKIKHPQNFFLLRGNHETAIINKEYGFADECELNYGLKIWDKFNDLFDHLPIAALINSRIFCCHGGISPELRDLNQILSIDRPLTVPESGLVFDLLWSDPSLECKHFQTSSRGSTLMFGKKALENMLKKFNLDLLVRAHQYEVNGFRFPFSPMKNIVTVFSAPNYCGGSNNHGAIMTVNDEMVCKFVLFEPIQDMKNYSIERPLAKK